MTRPSILFGGLDALANLGLSDDMMKAAASKVRGAYAKGWAEGRSGGCGGASGAYVSTADKLDTKKIIRSFAKEQIANLTEELRTINAEDSVLRDHLEAIGDVLHIVEATPILAKPSGCLFHKVIEAGSDGRLIVFNEKVKTVFGPFFDTKKLAEIQEQAHVFLIEHDWAGAFKNANIDAGEIKLPYVMSCFEFSICGHHVCIFKEDGQHPDEIVAFVKTKPAWVAVSAFAESSPFHQFVAAQIRAICISLDAEVATANVVRAPHKLNEARAKKDRLPLFDYHVVSLAKRIRPEPAAGASSSQYTRKRLHFRRGHWRHFPNHKTWIKWMLVGDPDLGFVDKHYRL